MSPLVHPGTVTRIESLGTFFSCAASAVPNASVSAAITIVSFITRPRPLSLRSAAVRTGHIEADLPVLPQDPRQVGADLRAHPPARAGRDRRNEDTRQPYGRVRPRGPRPLPSAAPARARRRSH